MIEEKHTTDMADFPFSEHRCHEKYAKDAKECVVEIGILNGDATSVMLAASEAKVFGIDPIIPDSMNETLIGDEELIHSRLVSKYDNFTFIKKYSYEAVKTWTLPIDYLFIDADHRYEMVKKDFEEWFIHVKQDGVISLHDSTANRGGPHFWAGPSKLADELIDDDRVEFLESVGCVTAFKKKCGLVGLTWLSCGDETPLADSGRWNRG